MIAIVQAYAYQREVCLCRMAVMLSLKRMDHLRVVGSAFLIHGQVVYCGHDQHIEETYKGPCMLPPSPALYVCGTDIKVCFRTPACRCCSEELQVCDALAELTSEFKGHEAEDNAWGQACAV